MNFQVDDQFFATVVAAAVALVVLVIVLRWRARCRSCGAWGQTMSCERCGAVNDPFAPTQPDLSSPESNASSLAKAFTRRDELRSTTAQQQAPAKNRPLTAFRPPAAGGKPGEPMTAAEASEALLQHLRPFLGLLNKVHAGAVALAIFVLVNSIPKMPLKISVLAAALAGGIVWQKRKAAAKCQSCGAFGDPKAITCASCGKQKRYT